MIPSGSRICESGWMRKGIEVRLGPGDRERLEAVIGSGNSPQKHVWRARIVLLSADGVGTMAMQRQTGAAAGGDRAGGRDDAGRAAGRGDALEQLDDGESRRGQPSQRAADL